MVNEQQARLVIEEYLLKPGEQVIEMPADGRVLSLQPRGPIDMVLQVQQPEGAPTVARRFWLENDLDLIGRFSVRGKSWDLFEDRSGSPLG
ncbi:MAG: hypothetical protein JW741_02205 [Sedimentisphaerales bacterium]|nr:hypothetical protein [Sedimentisphaerales bacterium]